MAKLDVTAREMALHAARLMLGKGAEDLVVLELPVEQRALYDYVVIGNGRSDRQTRTLAQEVYHFCKRHGVSHFPVEGESGWHLIDCHNVVVHAFTDEQRAYYRLDELWSDAAPLDYQAMLKELPDPDKSVA